MNLLRSVLYMPAANERAVQKATTIPCDAIIFDLEDAVAPDAKAEARQRAVDSGHERSVRLAPADDALQRAGHGVGE